MAEIGSLFINLAMQTAQFDRQLKQIDSQLKGFAAGVQKGFAGLKLAGGIIGALGVAEAAKAIGGWAQSMAAAGEEAENLATTLALTLDQVVEIQGVFRLTTGTLGEAQAAFQKMFSTVADAQGGQESAINNFKAIGISIQDLARVSQDPIEALKLLADRFNAYGASMTKNAVFADIFGKNWAKVAPLLREGSAGIEKLREELRKLDPNAAKAATAGGVLDKQIDTLSRTLTAISNDMFTSFAPAMTAATQRMVNFANAVRDAVKDADAFLAKWGGIVGVMETITNQGLFGVIKGLAAGDLGAAARAAIGANAADVLKKARPDATARALADLENSPLWDPTQAPNPNVSLRPLRVTAPPKGGGGGGGGAKDDAEADAKAVADAQRKLALTRLEADKDLADERFSRNKAAIQQQRDLDKLTADEAITREQELTAAKWLADRDYYAKKLEAARGDADQMIAIENAATLAHEKEITRRAELDHEKAKSSFDRLKEGVRDFGSVLESSFSNIFDSVVDGTFKLKNAFSSLMRDMGKMLASRAFKMIMEGPSGGGGLGGILTTALGGLFKIGIGGGGTGPFGDNWSAAELGMANGGSFRVGGAGSIDSQMVAFRATPGEMVDVTRQNQVGRGGGEVININLNPSEGWVAGVADQRIVTASGQIVNVAVLESQKRTARNFGSMSAQARDRQL